jgi:hypothetical protein
MDDGLPIRCGQWGSTDLDPLNGMDAQAPTLGSATISPSVHPSHVQDAGNTFIIGMDIHRSFAQVAILEEGQIVRELRVDLVHGPLVYCAKTLSLEDEVVIEATGNSAAVERLMRLSKPDRRPFLVPHCARNRC